MRYNITATVNTETNEYEHVIRDETSLDAAIQRILDVYPRTTSVVLVVVLYKE